MFLVFSADSFYKTAENFRRYTAKCGVGFSRTNTAHNIWSEIVAGENQYARVMGRLNAGGKLESCFRPESFISIMRSHHRDSIDEEKSAEIFAESIYPQLEQLSPLLYSTLSQYSEPKKYCFFGSDGSLGVFENGLPGYVKIAESSSIDYDETKAAAALLNYMLGHDAQRCFEFFANARREADKTAEFELEVMFRTNRKRLVPRLAIEIFDTVTDTSDFEEIRDSVYEAILDSIEEYRANGGPFACFLDIDNNIVADLIDLLAAGLVSESKWIIDNEDEEANLRQIEFTVESAFERLLPKSFEHVIS